MKVVVMTSPDKLHSEVTIVTKLFKEGLDTLHLRKPKFNREKMEEYLGMIPTMYHNRIIIHSHHRLAIKYKLRGIHLTKRFRKKSLKNSFRIFRLKMKNPKLIFTRSCHQLADLLNDKRNYEYVFLTPIFDGISKRSHSGGFSERAILATIAQSNQTVYALGGVKASNIEKVKSLGFSGAALLGAIWNSDDAPLDAFHDSNHNALGISRTMPQNTENTMSEAS